MAEGKLLSRNRCKCKHCGDIIESKHVHDFVECKCGQIFTDGGLDYTRRGYPGGAIEDHIEDMNEYEREPEIQVPK